jgi:hypothetical protein
VFKVSRVLCYGAGGPLRLWCREKASDSRTDLAVRPSLPSLDVDYCCAEQVDAIMRTDVTSICWAVDEPDDDVLLGDELLEVLPAAPGAVVEPALLDDPLELADASVPVTSTWWPLCCESSESRPSSTYVDPLIGMLLALPLPAVPAVVELGLLELGLLEVAPALEPAAPLDAVDELDAGRALVSVN